MPKSQSKISWSTDTEKISRVITCNPQNYTTTTHISIKCLKYIFSQIKFNVVSYMTMIWSYSVYHKYSQLCDFLFNWKQQTVQYLCDGEIMPLSLLGLLSHFSFTMLIFPKKYLNQQKPIPPVLTGIKYRVYNDCFPCTNLCPPPSVQMLKFQLISLYNNVKLMKIF